MEPVFSSSLATSYLSDSTAIVELPSFVRAQAEVAGGLAKEKEEDEKEEKQNSGESNPTIKAAVVENGHGESGAEAAFNRGVEGLKIVGEKQDNGVDEKQGGEVAEGKLEIKVPAAVEGVF